MRIVTPRVYLISRPALDYDEIAAYEPPTPLAEPKPEAPFSAKDALAESVARLPDRSRAGIQRMLAETKLIRGRVGA